MVVFRDDKTSLEPMGAIALGFNQGQEWLCCQGAMFPTAAHGTTSQDKLQCYVSLFTALCQPFFITGYFVHLVLDPLPSTSRLPPESLFNVFSSLSSPSFPISLFDLSYVFRALLMGVLSPPLPSLILCLLRRDPDTHSDIQINFVKILVLIPLFVLFLLCVFCLESLCTSFGLVFSLILPPDGGVL